MTVGLLCSALPYAADLFSLRRVSTRFFGVFMSINPALAAGLNAVFIPHDFTWVLEHEVVGQPEAHQQLLELASFGDLTTHF